MKSHTTPSFRKLFAGLPADIQAQARADYRQFLLDPNYPGLHLHQITRGKETLYSVYVGIHYRALATREDGDLYWFWIGHHSVYDKIVAGR